MATTSKLEFNALKLGPRLSLRRPLAHKPFLIPCRPVKRAPSLTVKARRFSNFKEHVTLVKEPQKDSHFTVEVTNYKAVEDPHPVAIAIAVMAAFSVLLLVAHVAPPLVIPFAFIFLALSIINLVVYYISRWFSPSKTSVLRLQVGLLGKDKSLQKDLNRIVEVADSSNFLLKEATVALLRLLDCCIFGYSCVDVKRIIEDGEKHFNRLSIEERAKIDEESLVNVNGTKKQSTMSPRANGFNNEYIVITILVAAEGVHNLPVINSSGDLKEALQKIGSIPASKIHVSVKVDLTILVAAEGVHNLPVINSSGDLKEALQKIGSIPASKIHAVDVIWTPEKENVTLTEEEVLEYHPLLRPF